MPTCYLKQCHAEAKISTLGPANAPPSLPRGGTIIGTDQLVQPKSAKRTAYCLQHHEMFVSSISGSQLLLEGDLQKRMDRKLMGIHHPWRNRFCLLLQGGGSFQPFLVYYNSKEDKDLNRPYLGVIPLFLVDNVFRNGKDLKRFDLLMKGGLAIVFQASSEQECDCWCSAIWLLKEEHAKTTQGGGHSGDLVELPLLRPDQLQTRYWKWPFIVPISSSSSSDQAPTVATPQSLLPDVATLPPPPQPPRSPRSPAVPATPSRPSPELPKSLPPSMMLDGDHLNGGAVAGGVSSVTWSASGTGAVDASAVDASAVDASAVDASVADAGGNGGGGNGDGGKGDAGDNEGWLGEEQNRVPYRDVVTFAANAAANAVSSNEAARGQGGSGGGGVGAGVEGHAQGGLARNRHWSTIVLGGGDSIEVDESKLPHPPAPPPRPAPAPAPAPATTAAAAAACGGAPANVVRYVRMKVVSAETEFTNSNLYGSGIMPALMEAGGRRIGERRTVRVQQEDSVGSLESLLQRKQGDGGRAILSLTTEFVDEDGCQCREDSALSRDALLMNLITDLEVQKAAGDILDFTLKIVIFGAPRRVKKQSSLKGPKKGARKKRFTSLFSNKSSRSSAAAANPRNQNRGTVN